MHLSIESFIKSVSTCHRLNVSFTNGRSALHCDGHSRWGLQKVTRGGQEWGASMNRIGALPRVRKTRFPSLSTMRWQNKKIAIYNLEDGTFLSPTILALWAWTSGLQNSKQIKVYCSSRLVYGILLKRLKLRHNSQLFILYFGLCFNYIIFHCSNYFHFDHWELSQLNLMFFRHASETLVGLILLCYEPSLTFWQYKMLPSLSLHLPLSNFLTQSLNHTLLLRALVLLF